MWGAFAYIGADLKLRFGFSLTLVGLTVACFGVGGLILCRDGRSSSSAGSGQTGLAICRRLRARAPAMSSSRSGRPGGSRPIAVVAIGLGFYMLHNTLQTNATQMTPEARGTAVAMFSSALYVGQTAGVATGGLVIDRFGAVPLVLRRAIALPALAIWFARELKRHRAAAPAQ